MKKIVLLFSVFALSVSNAQKSEEVLVKQVIDAFYDGLNERDSIKVKRSLSRNVKYQKMEDAFWTMVPKENDPTEVIRSIMAIPKSTKYRFEANDIKINSDSLIANAWVSTKFYLYDSYYQCGSTSIQLVKEDDNWKIISILDHYSKENCLDQN